MTPSSFRFNEQLSLKPCAASTTTFHHFTEQPVIDFLNI